MDKDKKKLMWTILVISLIQMPTLALTPGINQMTTSVFAGQSLGWVQTALSSSNLIAPFVSLCTAFLINRGLATKKGIIIFGLTLMSITGVAAVFANSEFWHLFLLSALLGIALGSFVYNAFGLLFDNFNYEQRQIIGGFQTSCINVGGIAMSLLGGLMATAIWYGGYFLLLIGFPVAVFAWFTVPGGKKTAAAEESVRPAKKGKLPLKVFYYSAAAFIFMLFYGVCGANISTHIAGIGNSATAGIAIAVQMSGGVVSGLFFGRISAKYKDMTMVIACLTLFVGYIVLGVFDSLTMTFIGVFIIGTGLSIMLPSCIFTVSALVDSTTSASATAIVSSFAPSLGGFLSPVIITNLTAWLFGESTAARYTFTGVAVLIFAAVLAAVTLLGNRRPLKTMRG